MPFTIGIDFGGVLSNHDKSTIDAGEHINTIIDMPYAIDALKTLHNEGHSLNIVSFCGRRRAYESLQSLADNNLSCLFTTQHYVKDRAYKAHICDYIGCHIMIDDRIDILDNIKTHLPHIHTILFGKQKVYNHHFIHYMATNWHDVLNIISTLSLTNVIPNKTINISQYTH